MSNLIICLSSTRLQWWEMMRAKDVCQKEMMPEMIIKSIGWRTKCKSFWRDTHTKKDARIKLKRILDLAFLNYLLFMLFTLLVLCLKPFFFYVDIFCHLLWRLCLSRSVIVKTLNGNEIFCLHSDSNSSLRCKRLLILLIYSIMFLC